MLKEKILDYPLTAPIKELKPLPRSVRRWQIAETWRWRLRRNPDFSHHLQSLDKLRQIGRDEIVVLTRQHNSLRFIRSFLRHYRNLGADRIIVIDDNSTDGSRELLEAQDDVIVLRACTSYTDTQQGCYWFDTVLIELPKNQRMIAVDIDEYLVFSDGQRPLRTLFDAMSGRRLKKLHGIMIDCYPRPPIGKAVFDGETDQMPWEVAPCFDTCGYSVRQKPMGFRISGGVRRRLFGIDLNLSKYPVFFNPGKPAFTLSIHATQPLTKNTLPVGAVLLHFKYFSDFVANHEYIASRGVHIDGAGAYQTVLKQLDGINVAQEFSFEGPVTSTYKNPAQLCELGLMEDICAP